MQGREGWSVLSVIPLSPPPRKAAHPDGGDVMGKPVKQIVGALAGLAAEARISMCFQSSFTASLLYCQRGQVTLQHSRHLKSCLKWLEAPLCLCLCIFIPRVCVCVCMCVYKSLQSCPTLCDPLDCSPPGSSVHGILQARILEWVAMPSSKGSSQPRDRTHGPCIAAGIFATEPSGSRT